MKREEEIVLEFLRANSFAPITYEPWGQSTPDFSIGNQIGIEVRRLNQHVSVGAQSLPIEDLSYSIQNAFKEVLEEFPAGESGEGAWLFYHFKRPLAVDKSLRQGIRKCLREHIPTINEHKTYTISQNLEIEFWPDTFRNETVYAFGGRRDENAGGFVTGNVYDALQLIIAEKWKKVEPVRSRYNEWWLALVDLIGYGFSELDLKNFHEHPRLEHQFDRILLVSPRDSKSGVFLYE